MTVRPHDITTSREGFLTRSRLRDVVILLSLCSVLFFDSSPLDLALSFSVLVLGSFIHVLAKGVLIRNEVFCKEGIYGVIRHPYYLANYLIDTSFCLASGNKYLLLCYPFLFFWSYGPTLRKEEATLMARHGEAVIEQIMKTPQLFPDRHSPGNFRALLNGFSFSRISAKEVMRNERFLFVWLVICALAVSVRPESYLNIVEHDPWHYLIPVAAWAALLGISAGLARIPGRRT